VWNRRKCGRLGGVFVFSLVVLLSLALGVVRLSVFWCCTVFDLVSL
jgi:hypothetical protein